MDDAERFLTAVHAGLPGWTEIMPLTWPGHRALGQFRKWFPTSACMQAACWSEGLSRMGHEVYFGVMPRARGNGTKAGITALSEVYVDVDLDLASVWARVRHLPWTAVVETSPDRGHLHGRVDPVIDPSDWTRWQRVQNAVVALASGDQAVKDQVRILRVPGTFSWKRSAPVRLLDLPGTVARVETWEEAIGIPQTSEVDAAPPDGWSVSGDDEKIRVGRVATRVQPSIGGGARRGVAPDFAVLAAAVGVPALLAAYRLTEGLVASPSGWAGSCPFHGGDNPRGFTITSDGRRWMCWTAGCGQPGGGVVDAARLLEGGDVGRAARVLWSLCGGPSASRTVWIPPSGIRGAG